MENPKIRFKGFTKDWEQRKVTDLGEIYIGLVTTMTEHYTDKGHLLIRNSDIKDGYFEFGENPIYLDEEFSEQNKLRMHQPGDVITVHTGDIGTSAVIGENEVNSIGFATIVTRPNQEILDSNYFATYLNTDTHKQWAVSMATGDGRSNYNLKDYTKLVVPIPEIEEQKKIAACIVNLNSLITLHQRKCEQTKKLKKYMLQKMFPQNGAKVPEIRFDGFTYDWEQRKLNEIGVVIDPHPSHRAPKEEQGGIPFIGIGDVDEMGNINRESARPVPENVYDEHHKRYDLNVPSLGLGRVASLGKVIRLRSDIGKYAISPTISVLQFSENINIDYLYAYMNTPQFKKQFEGKSNGSTRQSVGTEMVRLLNLSMPFNLDEQKAIGTFYKNLDNLITLHQRKCDELKKMKKYMLQNMFI